ncbi:MAG: N-acetyltransferase [Lachnospiraceae bacterium]|nr:N-acetyltransferase [Lachnospiraceae bacterium]
MITVKEVSTKKEQKEFLEFPNRLYKGNPYYVPPLYMDEKKIFRSDYVYYDTCEAVYFLASDESGRTVGRISGILQHAANEKYGQKRVRFTRLDAVDDEAVFKALFDAVEDWARKKGMNEIVGPLGFSDLEREGMLIDGFDHLATFEEQYNAPYYPVHVEALGYEKEVDWVESMVRAPKDYDGGLHKMSELIMKRYGLHWFEAKNVNDFIERYGDQFFGLLDRSYDLIYGTVPFTDGMKKMMIDNFKLIIQLKYVAAVLDENDRMVAFGICFPSLAKTMQQAGGKLLPKAWPQLIKALTKPDIIDFGLIGVDPEYLNRGVSACVAAHIIDLFKAQPYVDHAETNLNLEDNYAIRNLWKRFDATEHKKRRCYVKKVAD